jgi:hypothetical protein
LLALMAVVVATVLYAALGFLVLPVAAKRAIARFAAQADHRVTIGALRTNPFTLSIGIDGFSLETPDEPALLRIPRAYASLDLGGALQRTLVLKRLVIESPEATLQRFAAGDTSLSRLAAAFAGEEPGHAALPALALQEVEIRGGGIDLVDRSGRAAARVRLDQIDIEASALATRATAPGRFSAGFVVAQEGRCHIEGDLDLGSLQSTGRFSFDGLGLRHLHAALRNLIGPVEPGGSVTLRGGYRLAVVNDRRVLWLETATVDAREIRHRSARATVVTAGRARAEFDAELSGNGVRIDLAQTGLQVEALELQAAAGALLSVDRARLAGATLDVRVRDPQPVSLAVRGHPQGALRVEGLELESAGTTLLSVDRAELAGAALDPQTRHLRATSLAVTGGSVRFEPDAAGRSAWDAALAATGPVPGTEAGAAAPSPAPPWTWLLDELRVEGVDAILTREVAGRTARFDLADVGMAIRNLTTTPQARSEFSVEAGVGGSGRVQATGSTVLADRSAEASVTVSGFDLIAINPYLRARSALELRSGELSAELSLHLGDGTVAAEGRIDARDLALANTLDGGRALAVGKLTASGVTVQGRPPDCAPRAPPDESAGADPCAPELTVASLRLKQPYVNVEIDGTRTLNWSIWLAPPGGAEGAEGSGAAPPFGRAVIKRIDITEGSLDFADFSLSPSFRIRSDAMRGAVTRVSSVRSRTAKLEIEGRVDPYGTSRITGRLRPFDPSGHSDLAMRFRNIDTALLSPYSARFAGRRIKSGRLDLDLDYRIRDRTLTGENDIVLRDFVLGERVDSPDALDLPLDMAVALLQDSDGRIRMEVPVSGDLGNPQFDIRGVVGKAINRFLSGIVTAPFRVLAKLVGGKRRDLEAIPFEPGSADLTPPARESLILLSEALSMRPALAVRATGSYDPDLDRHALARGQIRLHIAVEGSGEPAAPEDRTTIAFSDPKTQAVLEELAGTRLEPEELDALAAGPSGEAAAVPEDDDPDPRAAYFEAVFETLVARETIASGELERLARDRAQAVVDELETLGVAPGRLSVEERVATRAAKDRLVAVPLEVRPVKRARASSRARTKSSEE